MENIKLKSMAEMLDNNAKELLSHRRLNAMIVQTCIPGFESYSLDEIEGFLGPPYKDREVYPNLIGLRNEANELERQTVTFDVLTSLSIEERLVAFVDIEAQGKFELKKLLKKMRYYLSRMTSMQYGKTFDKAEYEKLVDNYCVVINFRPSKEFAGTILGVDLSVEELTKLKLDTKTKEKLTKQLHKVPGIMINLSQESDNELIQALWILFMDERAFAEKCRILKEEYDLDFTQYIMEEEKMCGYSEAIHENGKELGIGIGKELGIGIGKELGIGIGKEIGEANGTFNTLVRNVQSLLKASFSFEEAMNLLEVKEELRLEIKAKLEL